MNVTKREKVWIERYTADEEEAEEGIGRIAEKLGVSKILAILLSLIAKV